MASSCSNVLLNRKKSVSAARRDPEMSNDRDAVSCDGKKLSKEQTGWQQ